MSRQETAQFAEQDAKLFYELAEELLNLNWVIDACGHDGKIEHDRVCAIAPAAIKALVNYLPNRPIGSQND